MNATDKNFMPIIVYLNTDRDAKILAWLETQSNKSAAVRSMLTAHVLSTMEEKQVPGQSEIGYGPENIRQTLVDTLNEHFDLALIRQTVEAAIGTVLFSLVNTSSIQSIPDPETRSVLNDLDDNLILE